MQLKTYLSIAGSGKSTLLVMIANILKRYGIRPEEVAVLAFGNKNKADLSKKFQEKLGIEWSKSVRTIHSLGYQLYTDALFVRHKLVKIQDWKYARIAERKGWMTDKNGFVGKLVESDIPAIRDEQEFIRLLELLRLYCYEPTTENVVALNREYRLSIINTEVVAQAAKECLEAGEDEAIFSTAMQLLAAGKPAKIKDEKLGRHLEYRIKRILKGQEDDSISFTQTVDCYREESRKVLEKFSDSEIRIGEVEDTLGAILALYEQYKPSTLKSWKKIVNQIFDESSSCPIELYTAYSGKGAEQKIAVVLYPEEMPIAYRQQPTAEREQEDHLIYVSLTRVLANGSEESGILYLVLREREDGVMFPSWLPEKYCQLWNFN